MQSSLKNRSFSPQAKRQSFEIEPLGPTIGAQLHGIDFSKPLDEESFNRIESALITHKVIFAREQTISTSEHVALGYLFGELEVHPFRPQGVHPELMVLDNHKDNPVLSTDVWHSDTTFRLQPTKYSILKCDICPQVGGDTLWADMQAAFGGLSPAVQEMIRPLRAVHDFLNFRALFKDSDEDRVRLRQMEVKFPNPSHPVVRTHPVTQGQAIYVNPQFTKHIEGMSGSESAALLALLFEQAHVPEYQFRLKWSPGTITFWDNQSTQHYACNDYYPNRRRMERVAVVGDVPM